MWLPYSFMAVPVLRAQISTFADPEDGVACVLPSIKMIAAAVVRICLESDSV